MSTLDETELVLSQDIIDFQSSRPAPLSPLPPVRFPLHDIGGHRVENNGAAQSVVIYPEAEYFCAFSEGGDSRLEIGGSMSSEIATLPVFEEIPLMFYPILPGQPISCYGLVGTFCNFRFLSH